MTNTNKLINETSPYLLQHAHNPVDWYPWGDEALQRAKEENKIILVSIGYSACHWCHVMEKESFEKEATAEIMNANFINIKIDREERPDLDHIYMDAVQAMTGSGGWPLNVFLTPGKKPFFGGTYFPPVKAFNRSSWPEVLQGVAQAWKERPHEIESQAENLIAHLSNANTQAQPQGAGIDTSRQENIFTREHCNIMFANIMKAADTRWGGFGKAPKFPQTFTIQYLLEYYYFTENKQALQQALLSVDKMLAGGIYDHIAGGMARYSTDNEWLAPHFEKMLYDNALLINILCDAYQITKAKKYQDAVQKTIAFVQQELTNNAGAFYAALDADSEGVEGKYYVWQKIDIENTLQNDAALFCEFFDVSENGNWEEKNILRILEPLDRFAAKKKMDAVHFEQLINECLKKLQTERAKRIKPSLDDKIILGWNALMMGAVAKAAIVFENEAYKKIAVDNFNFIRQNFMVGISTAAMFHTWKNGIAKYPAFLDDYAYIAAASIDLYHATYEGAYLDMAREYCEYAINHFSDEASVFFYYTHAGQKDIIFRKKEIYDSAVPSGNAVMANNLLLLSIIYDIPLWRERAYKMLGTISQSIIKYPASFGRWASSFMQQVTGINEISVVGSESFTLAKKISSQYYLPAKIIMASKEAVDTFPMLFSKPKAATALVYLCKNQTCLAPFKNAEELIATIFEIDKND